jgi:hypothetical protein
MVVWSYFFIAFFFILQPQFLVTTIIFFTDAREFIPYELDGLFLYVLPLVIAPFWSYCFGWLYVKFTNWLNHFPVLGKRVF